MTKRETREREIRRLLGREEGCPLCKGSTVRHVLDGGELRALRLAIGMEQKALAAAAGISAPYLNQMEHNVKKLNLPLADRLLKAMGI